ncbi:hypothetical protein QYM36_010613 [Artemia franciscana]|uniref:Endonuclease/exonuclease/phosphatase domain-containing protein n=1 Tax=Artemia franciscana TaxID=6661 RepID=A0AA88HS45_ARTSF|nr:hypothetical protein QYM36_010613 [Artemia franciscana]
MNISNWNILTLNFAGAEILFTNELKYYSLTIAGVTKTYLPGKGEKFIYSVVSMDTENTRRTNIGLAAHKRPRNALISHKSLLRANLRHRLGKFLVIVYYVPTKKSDPGVKDKSYTELEKPISSASLLDILLLLGDFNTTISDPTGIWKDIMGRVTP